MRHDSCLVFNEGLLINTLKMTNVITKTIILSTADVFLVAFHMQKTHATSKIGIKTSNQELVKQLSMINRLVIHGLISLAKNLSRFAFPFLNPLFQKL